MYLNESDIQALLHNIYTLSAPMSRILIHTVNSCEINPKGTVCYCWLVGWLVGL